MKKRHSGEQIVAMLRQADIECPRLEQHPGSARGVLRVPRVGCASAAETLRTAPSAPGLLREALRALWCAPVCSGVLRGGDG